jgi:hypothetical protein
MLVKNIHTIQTVYVHGPPPQNFQPNNPHSQIQNIVSMQRPVSAPKISINYSNHPAPTNFLAQNSIKPVNKDIIMNIVNQPKI